MPAFRMQAFFYLCTKQRYYYESSVASHTSTFGIATQQNNKTILLSEKLNVQMPHRSKSPLQGDRGITLFACSTG